MIPSAVAGKYPEFYDNSHVCIGLPLARKQVLGVKEVQVGGASTLYDLDPSNPFYVNITVSTGQAPGMYFSTAVFLGLNLLCFLIILICYMEIMRAVFLSSKRTAASKRSTEMREQINLTIKVAAIVATDFCCWCPIIVTGILVQVGAVPDISPSVFAWTVTFVLPINSAINPFLYTISVVIADYQKKKASSNSSSNKEGSPGSFKKRKVVPINKTLHTVDT